MIKRRERQRERKGCFRNVKISRNLSSPGSAHPLARKMGWDSQLKNAPNYFINLFC